MDRGVFVWGGLFRSFNKKHIMKIIFTIIKLVLLVVAESLTGHFFAKENLAAMGLLIGLYLFAFAVGELFGDDEDENLNKKDVIKGFALSIFLGVLGSIIAYHTDWPPVLVYLLFAGICIAPSQVVNFIQGNITNVLEIIKNKILK